MSSTLASFVSLVSSFPVVGFSGSRRTGSRPAGFAAEFASGLASCRSFRGSVSVGCAAGVDAEVRGAFPGASVFSVAAADAKRLGGRAFAARSAALVQSVAASCGVLVAFPLGECPVSVEPSRSFRGCGSGSWGSVALACGLGCPVLVVVPFCVEFPAPPALASRFSALGGGSGYSLWWAAPVAPSVPASGCGVQGALF